MPDGNFCTGTKIFVSLLQCGHCSTRLSCSTNSLASNSIPPPQCSQWKVTNCRGDSIDRSLMASIQAPFAPFVQPKLPLAPAAGVLTHGQSLQTATNLFVHAPPPPGPLPQLPLAER